MWRVSERLCRVPCRHAGLHVHPAAGRGLLLPAQPISLATAPEPSLAAAAGGLQGRGAGLNGLPGAPPLPGPTPDTHC